MLISKEQGEGIRIIIEDLQKEHTRWQERAEKLDKLLGIQDKISPKHRPDHAKHETRKAFCEAKMEYVELLIRRYRSWLP